MKNPLAWRKFHTIYPVVVKDYCILTICVWFYTHTHIYVICGIYVICMYTYLYIPKCDVYDNVKNVIENKYQIYVFNDSNYYL